MPLAARRVKPAIAAACRRPSRSLGCARVSGGNPCMFLDVVFYLASAVLDLLWWAVLLAVIVQMLIQFGVLDTRNRMVWTVSDFLYRVTEPLFGRIRRVLPNFGPVDLSPLVVLLLITAGKMVLGATANALIRSGMYFCPIGGGPSRGGFPSG